MASLNPLQGSLGRRRAAHLLRRTSYRYTKGKVDQLAAMTASQALDSLLQLYPLQLDQPVYDNPNTASDNENYTWCLPLPPTTNDFVEPSYPDFELRRYVVTWWLNEAYKDPGIGHKMAFFFHQFMAVTATSARAASFYDYLRLMRWGALGNYKKLATKLIRDNCMIFYLNTNTSTAANPNENFAREFLELFTIGKGEQVAPGDYTNYTEDDIVVAARVFTGIRPNRNRIATSVDPETGFPRGTIAPTLHDQGVKVFSDRFQKKMVTSGNTVPVIEAEIASVVDMIFAQSATAKTLCRRLYQYFVSPKITPEIESDIIAPLANTLISNNFEMLPVLRQLFSSQHFFDADDSDNKDEIFGAILKSPLELAYQSLSMFGMEVPANATPGQVYTFFNRLVVRTFATATFPIFQPADVAGYPAYYQGPELSRIWFSSSSIITRYKWGSVLLTGNMNPAGTPVQPLGLKLNIAPWLKTSGFISDPEDPYVLVKELLEYMLPEEVDNDRFNYFYQTVFLDNLPPADWTYEWQNYLATNNEAEVKIALERLVIAIMYSPEYQLM